MKKTILVTYPVKDKQKEVLRLALEGNTEYEFLFLPDSKVTEKEVDQATILIGNLPPAMLKGKKNLAWVSLSSAGSDAYALPGVVPEETILTNSSGAYGLSVAEHMMAFTFALIRHFPTYLRNQSEHKWQTAGSIISVEGSTVLILGLGDIGGRYARMVKALGAYTIGVRRTQKEKPSYLDEQYTLDSLDELLPRADIVAMVLPGGSTKGILTEERLRKMKPGAYLINNGRGDAIDMAGLKAVLKEGLLGGVALDVTDPEPLPAEDPLWDEERVFITPHISGFFYLEKTLDNVTQMAADNLRRFLRQEPLEHVVDRSTGY